MCVFMASEAQGQSGCPQIERSVVRPQFPWAIIIVQICKCNFGEFKRKGSLFPGVVAPYATQCWNPINMQISSTYIYTTLEDVQFLSERAMTGKT